MQHAFGVPCRHRKPAVTEYREHRCVFSEHVRLELDYSLVSRNADEMLQQPACDAPSLPGFYNGEAYLRGVAKRRVAAFGDDEFVASAWKVATRPTWLPWPMSSSQRRSSSLRVFFA